MRDKGSREAGVDKGGGKGTINTSVAGAQKCSPVVLFVGSKRPNSSTRRALLIAIVRRVSVGGLNCRRRG